jgi:hypothetical protein
MPEKIDSPAAHCKSIIFKRIPVDKMVLLGLKGFFRLGTEEKKSPHCKVWGYEMSIFYFIN